MIEFYSGTPGSGKSLHVAKRIWIKLFIKKQNVIANFDINKEIYNNKKKKGLFEYVNNFDLTPDYLMEFSKKNHKPGVENQTLVVIDECQLIFNSRDWQNKNRMAWIEFFTQHRKFGYNFILVSQMDRLVDRQIRALFEYDVIHRKINNFKFGQYMPFKVFIAVTKWYNAKQKVGSEIFFFKKKYGKLYDTFKNFSEENKNVN